MLRNNYVTRNVSDKEEPELKDFKLRTWKPEDAASLAAAANNPAIACWLRNTFPNPYTQKDAVWFISDCISNAGKNQLAYAIEADGKAVGSVGVFVKDDVYEKSAELGYWLSEEYWGKRMMSEAVRLICKEAFGRFDGRNRLSDMGNKGTKTKEKIRKQAYRLFAEKGFKAVTMTDICEQTGLSRGGLYRYYSGTDQIFSEILSEEYVI